MFCGILSLVLLPLVLCVVVNGEKFNDAQKQQIVEELNSLRRGLESDFMLKVEWSDELAKFSESDTVECVYTTYFYDSIANSRFYMDTPTLDMDKVLKTIRSWRSKVDDCTKNREGCIDHVNAVCDKTFEVGCAYTVCPSLQIWPLVKGAPVTTKSNQMFFQCAFKKDGCYIENGKWPQKPYIPGRGSCDKCPDPTQCDYGLCPRAY